MLFDQPADKLDAQVLREAKELLYLCSKADYEIVFDAVKRFIGLLSEGEKKALAKEYAELIWVSNDKEIHEILSAAVDEILVSPNEEAIMGFIEAKFTSFGLTKISFDDYLYYSQKTAEATKGELKYKEVKAPVTSDEILQRISHLHSTCYRYSFLRLLNALPTVQLVGPNPLPIYPAPRAIFLDDKFKDALAEQIGEVLNVMVRTTQGFYKDELPHRLPEDIVVNPEPGKTYFLEDLNGYDLWKVKLLNVYGGKVQVMNEEYLDFETVPVTRLRNWTKANEAKWKHDEAVRENYRELENPDPEHVSEHSYSETSYETDYEDEDSDEDWSDA